MAFEWNDRNIAHLREMWSKGMTAAAIALAIGNPSRNSVISAAKRAGCAGRPSPIKRHPAGFNDGQRVGERGPRRGVQNAGGIRNAKIGRAADKPRAVSFNPFAAKTQLADKANRETVPLVAQPAVDMDLLRASPSVPLGGGVRFADLEPRQCRWIDAPINRGHGDQALACGARRDAGSPYCATHHRQSVGTGTKFERMATEGVVAA